MSVQYREWLNRQKRYEHIKNQADEMSYIALAYLMERDFTLAAKSIVEMAKLYSEVCRWGQQDYAAIAYNKYGFDKKVRQIIAIASQELNESNLKVWVDAELQSLRKPNILILHTK